MNKEEWPEKYKIIRTYVNSEGEICCDYKGKWGNIENE